jgi:hypothetical protein
MEVMAVRLEAQTPAAGRRRREREEAAARQGAARAWGSRLLRETTTVYVYCLIIIKGVHVFM